MIRTLRLKWYNYDELLRYFKICNKYQLFKRLILFLDFFLSIPYLVYKIYELLPFTKVFYFISSYKFYLLDIFFSPLIKIEDYFILKP
jgi:hypothetical protein